MSLTRRDVKIAITITLVELVTLPVWLMLGNTAAGVGVLAVGLLTEHLISRLKG